MKGYTKQKILSFIENFYKKNGTRPTLQEICSSIGLNSVSTVHKHLRDLIASGKLESDDLGSYRVRNEQNKQDSNQFSVPIVGYIAAGAPIEAIEEASDYIQVSNLPKNSEYYALRVKGNSMIEDGIFDGDVVIIKKQSSAENGQTVVAIIDDNKATLKKIYRCNNKFKLQPANQDMLPFFRDEVEIRGVVWSIYRNFDKQQDSDYLKKEWRTVDLFAGVGGIRLGFESSGFKTVFANDFELKCADTYDKNFKTAKLVVEDIRNISSDDIPDCDFILGGFPCQAFSIAGYRQGFDDEKGRGNLFFEIARIIRDKQPTGFLLENVKNLKTHDNGRTFKVISETLNELGYHIKVRILNSMEYGNVPQNRERIYIVGFKNKEQIDKFEFPEPIKLTKTIKDVLDDKVDKKYYYEGKPLYDKLKNEVTQEGEVYQWRRQYVRQNKKGVCPTLTANMGTGGHNVPIIFDGKGIRKLTPRECFRIQGFPESYVLPNIADSALYKQAGNSVTVPVIRRISEQMLKAV